MYGQDHNDVIRMLAEHYPRCFFDDARQRRPLKKNIIADIEAQQPKDLEPYDLPSALR
jgi:sRNA-binding protein